MKPDKNEDAGLMPPISGIVLIMKDTHLPHLSQIWIIRASERPDLHFLAIIYGYIGTKC